MDKISNIVVISDTHFGCKLGLCPPSVRIDDDVTIKHSKLQSIVWWHWQDFWSRWVPMVTRGEKYIVVHNGDVIDGVHHRAVTQITQNIEDQKLIAIEAMRGVLKGKMCAGYYQIRGTEAHVGPSGQYEEAIARELGSRKDENGNHARWELWLRLGKKGSLIHFTHHVGTTSSAGYESTAVYKELVEAYSEAGRWNNRPPDCVVRSHRHRQFEIRIPTERGYGIALVTPGWQLKTPFVYRSALGRSGTPQIGGYLIREGDEDALYTRMYVKKVDRPREVIA